MSKKFVILFKGVDKFSEGEVVSEEAFPPGTEFKRLLDLKAIREADPHEAKQEKVHVLPKVDVHSTYESRLIEKDKIIADLKVKITQMEAEIQAMQVALKSHTPQPAPPAAIELIAEKEKEIRRLQAEKGKK